MILSIDLSPVLYKYFSIPEKSSDLNHFNASIKNQRPGDGGAHLSTLLQLMNEDCIITGFAGGANGDYIRSCLRKPGIDENIVRIGDETSERIKLDFKDRLLEISHGGPVITRDEIVEFNKSFKEALNLCETICLCGEYPSNIPEEMPSDIISMSRQWGRRAMVSPGIKALKAIVEASPYLLVITTKGLEHLTNLKLEYESEVIRASQYLFQNEIRYIMIDMDCKRLLVMDQEKGMSLEIPQFYETDSLSHGGLLAGFATGVSRGYDFETTARLSFACGALNLMNYKDYPDMSDIKAIMNRIQIRNFHNL